MVESGWAELSDGDEFAGYRIERRLGRGGMGILYLALEPGLERRVALKLIAPEAACDAVFARRFAEESRIAASIEHPNVVPIYAAGEQDGIPYIAMRYVAGSDLGQRIERDGRLEPERAVALIAQVANGLDAIHAAGLIHRDVKPANVLLSGEEGAEHAYITDFGVARNVSTQSGLTQTGRFVGTLDYVAPEQISGEPIDARVDVYALGCLLFKLLTGQVPFPREGEAARLYAHLNDPSPAPSLYVPAVPMALDDVVIRAMSKPPGDRPLSAGDLGRAAQAALSGTAVAVPGRTVATGAAATVESEVLTRPDPVDPAPTESKPESRGSRGRGWWLAGAGLAALAAVVVLVVVLSSGGGGDAGSASAEDAIAASTSTVGEEKSEDKPKKKSQPKTLTRAQLISGADAICTDSRETFLRYRDEFPSGESEPSVGYSQLLVGISSEAVAGFEKLRPPPAVEQEYRAYVASQRQVAKWDRDALRAAQAGDEAAYLVAREDRDGTEGERQQLAEAIGFHVCSNSMA
jgi:serine/threonine protein kinase